MSGNEFRRLNALTSFISQKYIFWTKTFSVLINKKECNYVYRLSYVGMKRELRGERFHSMSFQEYKNKFWHYLEVLDSNPLTTFLSLPDDVAHEITFVHMFVIATICKL